MKGAEGGFFPSSGLEVEGANQLQLFRRGHLPEDGDFVRVHRGGRRSRVEGWKVWKVEGWGATSSRIREERLRRGYGIRDKGEERRSRVESLESLEG